MRGLMEAHRVMLLGLANLLIPIAITVFASGFFPYKTFLPGTASYDDCNAAVADGAPFDKVVFVVIDALRSDFVYSTRSGFTYTQSLIRSGAALPFTAHAMSPTITMPRIKAMTTGSVPSFLDVILNFAEADTSSTLALQDTWPTQLKNKPGGKLVFYGDDTWLKLFPNTFSRADGTSSFFVSDFTEVDNNVTRHLAFELGKGDWNGMILHYLGLDHIGHKSGPDSVHMVPKQSEMDEIIKLIYEAIESKESLASTLLVLCGDHGMNDAGNHGGSTPGETSPALIFMSPKLRKISTGLVCPVNTTQNEFQYYKHVEQSDIAPTLAGLLGFPVPLNNLGIFIPEFLDLWTNDNEKIQLLYQNAKQVLNVVEATFGPMQFEPKYEVESHPCLDLGDAGKLQCLWIAMEGKKSSVDVKLKALLKFLRAAQDVMGNTASNYQLRRLQLGIAFAFFASLAALCTVATEPWSKTLTAGIFATLILTHGVTMFASSYVEEEQQFWYWMHSSWLVWLIFRSLASASSKAIAWSCRLIVLSILSLLMRRWNQTGQKYAGGTDIAKSFPAHTQFLWVLVAATYLIVTLRLARLDLLWVPRLISGGFAALVCLAALAFKVAFTLVNAPELLPDSGLVISRAMDGVSLVLQARIVFGAIGLYLAILCIRRCSRKLRPRTNTSRETLCSLHDLMSLALFTQSRVGNIPLLLVFDCQLRLLSSINLRPGEVIVTSVILEHASFFSMGGSNAISSIDLSNAYNGVSGYNVAMVGLLTFISNWSGPLWWSSATNLLLCTDQSATWQDALKRHISWCTVFVTAHLFFVMFACTILRAHLFVWTVFSPRYLYSIAWSLGQHLCINVLLTSFISLFHARRPVASIKISNEA